MSTHKIPFLTYKKEKLTLNFQVCSYVFFFKGLKNEFEIAAVNEPSVFETLKVYCILRQMVTAHVCLPFL